MTEELKKNTQFTEGEDPIEEALRAARVHQRAGRARETAAIFSKVLSVDPNNVEALTGMAEIANISDQPTASLPFYAKILDLDPENKNALNNRGIVLMNIGDPEASEFSFRKLLKFHPEDVDGLNNLGTNLTDQKRFEEAQNQLQKAIDIDANQPQAFYNMGVLKMRSDPENKEEQLRYFSKAIEIDPEYADAHSNIASIYASLNENEAAIKHIDQVLLIKPGDPINLFNKGLIYRKLKNLNGAIDCFKAARNIFPDPHIIDYEIGETHYRSGDLKAAASSFLVSVSERLSFSRGFIALGKTFAEMGQISKAKDAFSQAGDEPEAKARLHQLKLVTEEEEPWAIMKKGFEQIFAKTGTPAKLLWTGEHIAQKLFLYTAGIPEAEIMWLARLIPDVADRCNALCVVVRTSLKPLLMQINGIQEIVTEEDFDDETFLNENVKVTHLHAIPSLLGLEGNVIPNKGRYLNPRSDRRRNWDDLLIQSNQMSIGLFWRNTGVSTGPEQELKFEEYEPILSLENAQFFGLGTIEDELQAGNLRDFDVTDLGSLFEDLEDLAAAIDRLDLLVTSDGLAAHIAGALEKPTMLLLPLLPNYYWGYKTSVATSYPTLQLIRQSIHNDWDRPVQKALQKISRSL